MDNEISKISFFSDRMRGKIPTFTEMVELKQYGTFQTVHNRLAVLEQQGRIKRNGHGVEVM